MCDLHGRGTGHGGEKEENGRDHRGATLETWETRETAMGNV